MNISDKRGVFREGYRVLRPGGLLAPVLGRRRSAGEPYYPLPWATTPAISFLATPDELRSDLLRPVFRSYFFVIQRDAAEAFAPVLKRLETEGLPPLGEHVVTGEKPRNGGSTRSAAWLKAGSRMIEALARKPA